MTQGRLLVALNNRGVLVHRGDGQRLALLGVKFSDPPHGSGLDLLEALHRLAAGQNKTLLLLAFGARGFQGFIVEALQKGAQGRDLGKGKTQAPSKQRSPLKILMSSGQSPPAVCKRTNASRI